MPDIKYKCLSKRSTPPASLWLGPDHLLSISSTGYSETYKRFYFRDIQAIVITSSIRRALWNWIWGVPMAFCLVLCLRNLKPSDDGTASIVYAIIAGVFAVPLLINSFRGQACVCQLRTAVQIEPLPSLGRIRKTRRVLAKIRPLIAAAQGGELPADAAAAQMREWVLSSTAAPPVATAPGESAVPPSPAS